MLVVFGRIIGSAQGSTFCSALNLISTVWEGVIVRIVGDKFVAWVANCKVGYLLGELEVWPMMNWFWKKSRIS